MAAAKGKKNAKVKWAIGGSEPDDLPDFLSNDDIVKKNKGKLPTKGRTRVLVKKVTVKENRNGDDMLTVTCEIAESKGKKPGPFDGYAMWERLNVTEQGAPYLKRFLTAIGVKWSDFIKNTVRDETAEPNVITKIGKVNLAKPVEAFVSIRHTTDQNDEPQAEVGRFLPPADEDEDDDVDDDDVEEDDDDVEVDEDEEDDSEEDDEDSEDEDDEDEDDDEDEEDDEDDEEALRDELKSLKIPALKKRALRGGADEDDLPGKKPALIDLIVGLELGDEDDEEEDEDEEDDDDKPDEEELREELKGLGIQELRDRCGENGRKRPKLKGLKKPELIDLIIEDEVPPF